jgi:homoserine O-acetyltransferase/O-succinyltransferase
MRTSLLTDPLAVLISLVLLVLTAAVASSGRAQATPGQDYVVRDFHFADGEVLPELRMHYRAFGTPIHGRLGTVTNAVVVLHGTGGAGTQFLGPSFAGELFGPGQLLDTSHTFVILPDDIGHGHSSKPSDGMKAHFPRYAYADMVLAEYRLVTEGLHVDHLHLIMGTSMGCMHAWMWAERYPTFMDGLVPLACAPTQIAGRNRMWRKAAIDDIRNDPAWQGGNYATQPMGLTAAYQLLILVSSNPTQYLRLAPTRDAADSLLAARVTAGAGATDANDLLYQLEASRDYDPSTHLADIVAPVLAINSADDVINPPELGVMERLIQQVKRGRYVLIPQNDKTNGHGTHTLAAVWKAHLAAFLQSLSDGAASGQRPPASGQ